MRTIDAKAEKTNGSMRLVDGSMKAKAEKFGGGGSMRLVDSSMKSKAGKWSLFTDPAFLLHSQANDKQFFTLSI